ncbi:hypothetical protein GGG16DRAFT_64338 [Schizophyllum commune]
MSTYIPTKIDLTPRRHHGYAVLLFIMGTLFPPLAVAARFGIGKDFWLNLLLTICGYIPGHGHNFYIQNIRNNKTHARTPKWAQRYGLIDTSTIRRHERRSQWANRYKDRNPTSALEGQPYEEGQRSTPSLASDPSDRPRRANTGDLWSPEDEQYYNANNASTASSGRWKYPANFDDAVADAPKRGKKKGKDKKDRWARTEDAYSTVEEQHSRRKKSKKSKRSTGASIASSQTGSTTEFPEDPEGGLYGERTPYAGAGRDRSPSPVGRSRTTDDDLNHQF